MRTRTGSRTLDPTVFLVAAAGAHLGLQVTVRSVVYPALRDVPEGDWHTAHTAHSRRIAPLVALVYAPLIAATMRAVAARPGSPSLIASAAGTGTALVATGALAAPIHRGLSRGASAESMTALFRVDTVRLAAAAVGLAGALVAAAGERPHGVSIAR